MREPIICTWFSHPALTSRPTFAWERFPPQKVTVIFNHPKKGFLAFDVKNLALSSALFDFIEYIQEDETFTLPEETSRKVVQETLEKLRAQQR